MTKAGERLLEAAREMRAGMAEDGQRQDCGHACAQSRERPPRGAEIDLSGHGGPQSSRCGGRGTPAARIVCSSWSMRACMRSIFSSISAR